jgi:cytochrome P450
MSIYETATPTSQAELHMDVRGHRIRLNPRDPHFYNNPYPYYDALRTLPQPFYWEDFDLWCFARWDDVNACCATGALAGRSPICARAKSWAGRRSPMS